MRPENAEMRRDRQTTFITDRETEGGSFPEGKREMSHLNVSSINIKSASMPAECGPAPAQDEDVVGRSVSSLCQSWASKHKDNEAQEINSLTELSQMEGTESGTREEHGISHSPFGNR